MSTALSKKVDLMATAGHFIDHLVPVWNGLPEENRGTIFIPPRFNTDARRAGLPPEQPISWPPKRGGHLTIVASVADAKRIRRLGMPMVYLCHGIGQSYQKEGHRHESYPGGRNRDDVILFLAPNEISASEHRRFYPDVRSVAIGAPKMDRWQTIPPKPQENPPAVVISFHWNALVCPESKTALPEYKASLETLRDLDGIKLYGHGHPRIMHELEPEYKRLGIPILGHFSEVLEIGDLYVCDNSSTIPEFASTDRPVLLLNASWYRRDVNHGIRFWDCADMGIQCDTPEELPDKIFEALEDRPSVQKARRDIIDILYEKPDGKATHRAVQEILDVIGA